MFLRTAVIMAAGFLTHPTALRAQAEPSILQYSAGQLNCARFREVSRSKILTQSGGRDREQASGRISLWSVRASPAGRNIVLEAWLDSLSLWRQSAEATLRPDTDGLLGGRYRGLLSPPGTYSGKVIPFIPDEVAEVAGMATALDDFFPALPPHALHSGEVWTSGRVTIRRLADSALSGVLLQRFELQVKQENRRKASQRDTFPLELRQSSEERGTFVWHPTLGLLHRERLIVVTTAVPAGPAVRQAIRSRVEQQITLTRDLTALSDSSGRCTTPS